MFDMLLKSLGLTPELVQQYTTSIVDGVKMINTKIDNLLISAQNVDSRLIALEEKLERLIIHHNQKENENE